MKNLKILIGVLVVLAISGGLIYWDATRDHTSEQKKEFAARDEKMREIEVRQQSLVDQMHEVAGEQACEEDGDCRVLGLGVERCGGYRDFLFYSRKDSQEETLIPLVREFNKNQTEFVNLSLTVPDCGVATPRVICKKGKCKAVK